MFKNKIKPDPLPKAVVVIDPFMSTMAIRDAVRNYGCAVICWVTLPPSFYQEGALYSHLMPYVHLPPSECGFDWMMKEEDSDKGVAALKASPYEIIGIIPVSEPAVDMADYVASKFALPRNDEKLAHARRDKGLMKEAARTAGLRIAEFARCKTRHELKSFADSQTFPIIIKNPSGSGTVDVYRVESFAELQEKFEIILTSLDVVGKPVDFALAEEFIDGKEYIVNMFGDGEDVHVTDIWLYEKDDSQYGNFLYHNTLLQDTEDPALRSLGAYAVRLAHAIGVTRGPMHAEIMIDKKGPVMIEIAARYSGLGAPLMLRDFSNFDPFKANVEVFTKGFADMPDRIAWDKSVAIATPAVDVEGRIVAIHGVEDIIKLPTYHSHKLLIKEGDAAVPTTNLTQIPLYAWFVDDDAASVQRDANAAHELFKIETAASPA